MIAGTIIFDSGIIFNRMNSMIKKQSCLSILILYLKTFTNLTLKQKSTAFIKNNYCYIDPPLNILYAPSDQQQTPLVFMAKAKQLSITM